MCEYIYTQLGVYILKRVLCTLGSGVKQGSHHFGHSTEMSSLVSSTTKVLNRAFASILDSMARSTETRSSVCNAPS